MHVLMTVEPRRHPTVQAGEFLELGRLWQILLFAGLTGSAARISSDAELDAVFAAIRSGEAQ